MGLEKSRNTLGKDHYRFLYQTELEREAEWLRRGAAEKANSIETLLTRNAIAPRTILELGCGTGSVITECQRRRLAAKYIGVDFAPEAIGYLRKHSSGIEAIQGDITDPAFCIGDTCDVVVLTHVLEHLEQPAAFLAAMRNSLKPSYAIIEVPLDDLPIARMKSVLRDRRANRAGHVQFFTANSFERLLHSNGLKVIDRRTYVPIRDLETIRFLSEKDGAPWRRRLLEIFTSNYLPRIFAPLWKRLYYAHHAVLCVPDSGQAVPRRRQVTHRAASG